MSGKQELRCPFWPREKFGEIEDGDGLLMVACRKCKRAAEVSDVNIRVIHTFDLLTGKCVDTEEEHV